MDKKIKLLNNLIDEIGLVEKYAINHGVKPYLRGFDRSLALHKTKAFKIIDTLINLKENET